MHGLAKSGISC